MEWKPKDVIIAFGLLITIMVLGYFVFENRIDTGDAQTVFKIKMGKESFVNKNVHEVIDRAREVASLPEKLYIQDDMTIFFDQSGSITAMGATLCGKDGEGRIKNYLLSYDQKKSENMTITVEKAERAIIMESRLINPLFDTLSKIDVLKIVSDWNEKEFGILYRGYRSFGYNPAGIVYVDHDGKIKKATKSNSEFAGNFVSIYVPNKEDKYQAYRYLLVENLKELPTDQKDEIQGEENTDAVTEKRFDAQNKARSYVNDKIGFSVDEMDAAAGTRYYCLNRTKDGGATWEKCNKDPFAGKGGIDPGAAFFDEKLGFLTLRSPSQSHAGLYRTEDGGTTFKEIVIKSEEKDGAFDFPEPPYMEDGMFKLRVTKGADADNPESEFTIYASKDQGKTWAALEKSGN